MRARLRRTAILLAAFAAFAANAFGQPVADTLPMRPIPYKALKTLGAKPKHKAAAKPATSSSAAAAVPAKPIGPSGQPTALPAKGVAATAGRPPLVPAVKPGPPPPVKPAVTPPIAMAPPPIKAAAPAPQLAPKPSPSPVKTLLAAKPPSATPAAPPLPPPPLMAPQPGARLQPGQAMPASELEAFVDGQVAAAMRRDHVAGVEVAAVQDGQLVMEKGYGSAALSPARPMNPRATLVRLGSASQLFTWIAVLKAVQEGKLDLDAPVNRYLPDDLKIPDEGFDHPVLLRHLMSHTAGFEDRALGRRYTEDPGKLAALDEALQRLRPRRVRAPGLLSIPSTYGAALGGALAARVEGRPFDQLIETEILKPLALTHTSFREPYPATSGLPDPLNPALAGVLAQGFRWTGHGLEAQSFAYAQSFAPALSASSTADDMARLMIALLNNGRMGEVALYDARIAALLRAPLQRPAPGMDGWAHGLAMQRLSDGAEALTDAGAAPGFRSSLTLVPGLNIGVFIAANTDTAAPLTEGLAGSIVQRFYGGPAKPQPAADGAEPDSPGTYLSAQRAYHGLEAFADRLTKRSVLTADDAGGLVLSETGAARSFAPTANGGRFTGADGVDLLVPTSGRKAPVYVLGSGQGAAERVGGIHALGVLQFWAALTSLTVLASFAGLFIRERTDPRETRAQIIASVTQILTCVVWCIAFAAFAVFIRSGLSTDRLMFDWPNNWLVAASWSALLAGVLSLLMVTQLPGVLREERRIHGWSVWRKLRHTATVAVFLVFTAVLAAWGALEPWSS